MGEKRGRAKREKLAMIVITVFMVGASAYLLAGVARDWALARLWLPTECTIVSSTVAFHYNWNDKGRDSYSAQVVFTHEADGKRYQATDNGRRYSDPVEARVKAAAEARYYQPGQVVPCVRVKGLPRLAAVFGKDIESADFLARAIFGVALLLIPVIVAVIGRRKRR